MRRRTVLTVAGLAGGAAACSRHASEPGRGAGVREVTVVTGFNITGQDAPLYVAEERGWFAEVGLRVRVLPGRGMAENLKVLRAGQAQFAVVDLTGVVFDYAAAGASAGDVVVTAAVYQRSVSCLMALARTGIGTPKDLAGRRIGYQPGGINVTLWPTYARLAGVDPGAVRWVQAPPPQLRQLLAAGQFDAVTEIVIGRPAVEAAAGQPVTVLPYSDYLSDLYGNAVATSTALARADAGLVRRFQEALLRGLVHAIDHPQEAGRVLAARQPTYRAEAAAAELRAAGPYVRSSGTAAAVGSIDPARVARSIALLQGVGAIPAGLAPEQVVSFGLAPTGSGS